MLRVSYAVHPSAASALRWTFHAGIRSTLAAYSITVALVPRLLIPLLVALLPGAPPRDVEAHAPHTILWAWERPEDLRFLDDDVGVAFLAATIRLRDGSVTTSPRRQPLRVKDTAHLTAVVRIETRNGAPLGKPERDEVVRVVAGIAARPGVRAVQIDFDAKRSQRDGYRQLLSDLRGALPPERSLSITALASWCVFDRWMDENMPVDEVVPMVFDMGRGGSALRAQLSADGDFRDVRCREAVGHSTWEPPVSLPGRKRTYWFHDSPWTPEVVNRILPRNSG